MDLTQGTAEQRNSRSRKMMLWIGMASLIMGFAGWTSAYIVSSKRADWLESVVLPSLFTVSTAIILISSLTYWLAQHKVKQGNHKRADIFLWLTLALGILFIVLQFMAFNQMITEHGYRFTGPTSNIKMSYIYFIAFVHILHVVAGIITLIVVMVRQMGRKYGSDNMLGFELGSSFWHFLGFLWLYLVLFMYFVG